MHRIVRLLTAVLLAGCSSKSATGPTAGPTLRIIAPDTAVIPFVPRTVNVLDTLWHVLAHVDSMGTKTWCVVNPPTVAIVNYSGIWRGYPYAVFNSQWLKLGGQPGWDFTLYTNALAASSACS
jgi:hypothetical protein